MASAPVPRPRSWLISCVTVLLSVSPAQPVSRIREKMGITVKFRHMAELYVTAPAVMGRKGAWGRRFYPRRWICLVA